MLVTAGDDGRRRFLTERWAFRRGHLFLVPGDSPVGLRLPLGSLPEITFLDYPNVAAGRSVRRAARASARV